MTAYEEFEVTQRERLEMARKQTAPNSASEAAPRQSRRTPGAVAPNVLGRGLLVVIRSKGWKSHESSAFTESGGHYRSTFARR